MKPLLRNLAAAAFAVTASIGIAAPTLAADAICYNCPPQWADWATQLKVIKEVLGYDIPHDNKNSGQTLSQLLAEKDSPVADVAYYGVSFGIAAKEKGVADAYKPKNFDEIPEGLKDPDGQWFTIHSGALGFFVNKDALGGAPVPTSWA
ncbi:MAG: ABC transporter substrate-binding protein, partial [Rhizobiales bacterium]|nr:ABC transporter substrate-binding protein [Hyphomicrobiales bacterium]